MKPCLKTFNLLTCEDLAEVEIYAPGLSTFTFLRTRRDREVLVAEREQEGFHSLEIVMLSYLTMDRAAVAAMMVLFKGLVGATLMHCSIGDVLLRFSPRLASAEVWSHKYNDIALRSEALESLTVVNHYAPGNHVLGGLEGRFFLLRSAFARPAPTCLRSG